MKGFGVLPLAALLACSQAQKNGADNEPSNKTTTDKAARPDPLETTFLGFFEPGICDATLTLLQFKIDVKSERETARVVVERVAELRDGVSKMTQTYPSKNLDSEAGQRRYQDAVRTTIHEVLAPRAIDEVHFGYFYTKREDINRWKNRYPEKWFPEGHPCHWGETVD